MKKSWIVMILFVVMLCVPNTSALMSEFTFPSDSSVNVTVQSTVTEINPSEYLYSYQIIGVDHDQFITSLSVPFSTPLTNPSEVYGFVSDAPLPPYYWDVIGNPAVAAQAFFAPLPLDGGLSPVLSFKSIYASQEVQGYVNDAQLGSLYGTLLAPVPEPSTLLILSIDAGLTFRRKYKNANKG